MMSFDPESPDPYASPPTGQRATLPAIFLIIVGVLNLLAAGFFGLRSYQTSKLPEADLQSAFEQLQEMEQYREMFKQYKISNGEDFRVFVVKGGTIFALVTGIPALLTLLGGVCMSVRTARWLAILGSVVAAVPCVSPSACCLLGMGVGIWALVVLFSADVKAAFR
jgi:hypothetical protein